MNFLATFKQFKKDLLKKENIFFCTYAIIIFFLDRLSKLQIINNHSETSYFVNDYINYNLIWNTGIGFGLLSTNSSSFYNFVTILIGLVVILLVYFFTLSNKIDKFLEEVLKYHSQRYRMEWKEVIISYLEIIEIILIRKPFTDEMIYSFQDKVDKYYEKWINLTGRNGMTNYIHFLGSGHVAYYLFKYRNLYLLTNTLIL